MSRCFPFPPPGYERKHRQDELDVLKKVKRKEKKQNKLKKDKERKKNKEKEKDGRDRKLKDRKERKRHKDKTETHRAKKDKEERGKDKEKSSISEESAVAGKIEEQSREDIHPKGRSFVSEGRCSTPLQQQNMERPSRSLRTEESISLQRLNLRFRDSDKGRGNKLASPSSVVDGGKCITPFERQNEGRPSQSSVPFHWTEESRIVRGLDWRYRDRGSQLPDIVAGLDNRDQAVSGAAARNSRALLLVEEKDDIKDRGVDCGNRESQRLGNSSCRNAMVLAVAKSNVIGIPVDAQKDRVSESGAKCKETGEDKGRDEGKERDKSHRKGQDIEKEKKKDKAEVKIESKKSDRTNSKDVGDNGRVCVTFNKFTDLLDTNSGAVNQEHIWKRKDRERNGFLHESEIRPGKMQRPAPVYKGSVNVKILEAYITSTNEHDVLNSVGVCNKDPLVNGIIEVKTPSPSKHKKPSPASGTSVKIANVPKTPQANLNNLNETRRLPNLEDVITEASRGPPHPDSQHIGELLTIPIVQPWPKNDNKDWLLRTKCHSLNPKTETPDVDVCVWSEAIHIESADISALPYVIPY